jgi:VWFA-related protein
MRVGASIAAVLVLCAAPVGSSVRDPFQPSAAQVQGPPVFSISSDLVALDVLVRDRKGVYVTGLTADAFTVEEDGVRQTIQFFAEIDAPATVGLIIDSSGSMAGAEKRVIAAVGTFVETSNPEDEVFALAFGSQVRSVLPPRTPFTGDARTLREALTAAFKPWGRTTLYDAIVAGFDYLARGTRQRKALVIVSDGGDNASRATLDHVMSMAAAAGAVIYTIALTDRKRDAHPEILKRLARTSGGTTFQPKRPSQVEKALRLVAHDIRNSYTLGYVSTNAAPDGRLRLVRVTAERRGERDLQVRTRKSYVAGAR